MATKFYIGFDKDPEDIRGDSKNPLTYKDFSFSNAEFIYTENPEEQYISYVNIYDLGLPTGIQNELDGLISGLQISFFQDAFLIIEEDKYEVYDLSILEQAFSKNPVINDIIGYLANNGRIDLSTINRVLGASFLSYIIQKEFYDPTSSVIDPSYNQSDIDSIVTKLTGTFRGKDREDSGLPQTAAANAAAANAAAEAATAPPPPPTLFPGGASADPEAATAAALVAEEALKGNKILSDECELFFALPSIGAFNRKVAITTEANGIVRKAWRNIIKFDNSFLSSKKRKSTIFNNLATISETQTSLFYLKQPVLSAFVPNIEIAKVILGKDRKPKEIVRLDIPKSVGFEEDNLLNSAGIRTNTTAQNYYNLSAKRNQIGVKSFNWRLDNTNQETSGKFVSAELELSMDSIDSLFAERLGKSNKFSLDDPSDIKDASYRLSDLLIQPDCLNSSNGISVSLTTPGSPKETYWTSPVSQTPWIPECYEILVTVGNYTSPDLLRGLSKIISDGTGLNSLTYAKPVNDLTYKDFDCFKTSLYLTLTKHEFDFKDDGSVSVKAYYQGRMETGLKSGGLSINIPESDESIDLRPGTELYKNYNEIITDIKNKMTDSGIIGLITENPTLKSVAIKRGYINNNSYSIPDNTSIKNLYLFAEEITNIVKTAKPTSTVDKYFQDLEASLKKFRSNYYGIYFQAVTNSLLGNKLNYFYSAANTRSALSSSGEIANFSSASTNQIITGINKQLEKNHNAIYNDTSIYGGNPTISHQYYYDPSVDSSETNHFKDIQNQPVSGMPADIPVFLGRGMSGSAGTGIIQYYAFGDILSAMVTRVNKDPFELFGQTKILLGSFAIPNPNNPDNPEVEPVYMDLGDLPVPVKMFQEFVTNQTKNEKPVYSFFSMLNDFINQVLKNILNPTCKLERLPYSYSIKTYYLTVFNAKDTDAIRNTTAQGVDMSEFFERGDTMVQEITNPVKSGTPLDIVYLSVQGTTNYSLVSSGDLDADLRNKIPHIRYSSTFGIFKTVKFSKDDLPFAPEARATSIGGLSNVGQFSGVYKATIEAIGNNLLRNGDLVYIDATYLGRELGKPTDTNSLSWLMGLGGLYIIIKTDHNLTSNGYNTTYEARFVSRATRNPSSQINSLGEEPNAVQLDFEPFYEARQAQERASQRTRDYNIR